MQFFVNRSVAELYGLKGSKQEYRRDLLPRALNLKAAAGLTNRYAAYLGL